MSDKLTPKEIAELQQRLADAEETLRAITAGEVDALVVNTKLGDRVFTLEGADTVYRIAIENINEGAITLSPEGTILYSNRYFAKMMRADLNKIIGTSIFDFTAMENRSLLVALLAQDSGRTEIALRAADSTQVPAYVAIRKLQLDNLTICAVVTDLTEQKRSEEMLATRNLIQSILEQSPNAVIVCDAVGTVLYTTQAAQCLAGRPTLGHSIDPVLSNIRFSDKPLKFADVQNGSIETDTIVSCRNNGDTLTFLLRHAKIAQDGGVRGYVISLADITQLKKAEEALKESEERFRVLSEESPIGVGVSSADGVLLYTNRSYELLLGYNQGELVGTKAIDLYWNPEDRRSWVSDMKNNGIVRNVDTRLKRKDGTLVWVSINVSPVSYGGKQAVLGTIQDITERKKSEAIKDEFIGLVSHELRTPLTVIIGALATAKDERASTEEREELVQEASSSAESLAAILDNMLELSRYQAGRLKLEKKAVRIAEIAGRAVHRVEQKYGTHDIVLEIPDEFPEVQADAVRIEQVLYNLVENAVKYSPPGSKVRVFGRREKKGIVVGVSDCGAGIPSEDQLKLFEPFARLKGSGAKGVGLGLVVCKRLVEAHNGRIWIQSKPGEGSTFLFTVPTTSQ